MPRRKAGTSLPVARRATTIRGNGASGTPPPTRRSGRLVPLRGHEPSLRIG
ncbi:MAG: hypothetical protein IKS21_00235 [Oscillospiraceae bacterium]|nr:hypothetical protein [Oscillospiraceae bacterium]